MRRWNLRPRPQTGRAQGAPLPQACFVLRFFLLLTLLSGAPVLQAAEALAPLAESEQDHLKMLTSGMREAPWCVLYHGTPRVREGEPPVDCGATVKIEGFEYYPESIELDDATRAAILALYADSAAHLAYRGPKFCSGFHPDFLIVWSGPSPKDHYTLAIAMGCGEWRGLSATNALHSDLPRDTHKRIRELLPARKELKKPDGVVGPPGETLD